MGKLSQAALASIARGHVPTIVLALSEHQKGVLTFARSGDRYALGAARPATHAVLTRFGLIEKVDGLTRFTAVGERVADELLAAKRRLAAQAKRMDDEYQAERAEYAELAAQPTTPKVTVGEKITYPNARFLRPVLREAGLEQYIERVTSGRRHAYLYVSSEGRQERPGLVEEIAAVLRPLWRDGASRVNANMTGLIQVERIGAIEQPPAPSAPEGLDPLLWAVLVDAAHSRDGLLSYYHRRTVAPLLGELGLAERSGSVFWVITDAGRALVAAG